MLENRILWDIYPKHIETIDESVLVVSWQTLSIQ